MDMMSDFDSLDIMVGNENINPIERKSKRFFGDQQFNMTFSLISVQWIIFIMKVKLETPIMETIFPVVMKFYKR